MVELLVVVAILAVLLAILLPVLSRARHAAQTTTCLANLRSAAQAMLVYVSENKGQLPGSPSTSGRHLWTLTDDGHFQPAGFAPDNVPGSAIELFDYIGPLSRAANISLPQTSDGMQRLRAYRQLKQFHCPANDILSRCEAGAPMEDGPMLSYCTGTAFMLLPARIPTTLNTTLAGFVTMPTGGSKDDPAHFNFWSSPPGYQPKLEKVGPPSRKVFLADAGRRSRHGYLPTFMYNVDSDYTETLFSDFGPFYGVTRSYDRRAALDPSSPGDGRLFAFRHGADRPRAPSGSFRMNVVFFDGHAETLDDVESARPDYWLPTGSVIYRNTKLNATDTVFWPDIWEIYLSQTTPENPYRVP